MSFVVPASLQLRDPSIPVSTSNQTSQASCAQFPDSFARVKSTDAANSVVQAPRVEKSGARVRRRPPATGGVLKHVLLGAAMVAARAVAASTRGVGSSLAITQTSDTNPLRRGAMSVTPSTGPAPYMVYSGGPVISNVHLTSVFWGPNVTFQEQINAFYADITNSTFIDQLAEYSTPNQTIGRGSFAGNVTLTPTTGRFIADDDIQAALTSATLSGALPRNTDGNALFMVHFPQDTYISLLGKYSCWDFFAYHSTFLLNDTLVTYGVVPDQGGLCARATADALPGGQLGQTTISASHELAESVTDPAVGLAIAPLGPPLAWYDVKVGEIADACQLQSATVGSWNVQKVWSQKDNGCIGPNT